MDASDQAAEQIIRITLQGSEVTLRLTGSLAKNTAALLFAAAQNQQRSKGNTNLATLLKTEKELSVFQLRADELTAFKPEARRYGVLYHIIEKPKDLRSGGMVDVLVKAADAAKMNRIYDLLGIGVPAQDGHEKPLQTDRASHARKNGKERRGTGGDVRESAKPDARDIGAITKDEAVDKLAALRAKPPVKEGAVKKDPLAQGRAQSLRSEPTSEKKTPSGKATDDRAAMRPEERPSVKREIKEIRQEKRTRAQTLSKERQLSVSPEKQNGKAQSAANHIKVNKKEGR